MQSENVFFFFFVCCFLLHLKCCTILALTYCGLVMQYADILGQHWPNIAWWHLAITWTSVDLSQLKLSISLFMAWHWTGDNISGRVHYETILGENCHHHEAFVQGIHVSGNFSAHLASNMVELWWSLECELKLCCFFFHHLWRVWPCE